MIHPDRRFLEVWDIAVALLLSLLASLAAVSLSEGSTLRLVLTAPMILFAPGYLLMQAVLVPKRPGPARLLHALLSVGVSLAVVGLVALSTAIVRGGFRPGVIIAMMTLTCIALGVVGGYRRLFYDAPRTTSPGPFWARIPRRRRSKQSALEAPRTEDAVLEAHDTPPPPSVATASGPDDLPVITASEAPPPSPLPGDRGVSAPVLVGQRETP